MPKKKKKAKSKKKTKVRKKTAVKKKTKVKRKKSKKILKQNEKPAPELVIKTKPEWIKSSLANKSKYEQKYSQSIKNTTNFGKKREKELLGLNLIKKLKMLNTVLRK